MAQTLSPETGRAVLKAFLEERSLLAPLRIMAAHIGRFFQIPLPGFRPYVVFGSAANRQLLVTERDKFRWRNPDPVTDLLGHGVLVADGQEHDHYRSLMEPALQPRQLSQYVEMMVHQTDRVSALWGDGEIVDLLIEGRKIALLIILQALFGVDAWDDLPRIWIPILKAIEYISPGTWILWRRIPRPGYKKHLRLLDEYLYGIIHARRGEIKDDQHPSTNDLLQHLIQAGLDDELIRDQMLTMLIAGHDTSTALLAWSFALLGQHPETYHKLVSELDQSLGGYPPSTPAGWQPFLLDQVIKEALRLYPPIHIGNRMVAEMLEIGGHQIPAGERVFYSIYLSHRDPEVWDQPDAFCPERFERGRRTPPMTYVPFGGGPRACLGAAFGQAEARIVLGRLLQTFHFELIHTEIRPHMGATLEPRPGVMMKVMKRN